MAEQGRGDSERLLEALLEKEAMSRELFEATRALDQEITEWLIPTIQRRRAELDRLRRRLPGSESDEAGTRPADLERRLAASREEVERLRAELAHVQAEAAALRRSRSWRITAPLRMVFDILHRLLPFRVASAGGAPRGAEGGAGGNPRTSVDGPS